jgi:exosortase A-associated hydrolase 1
LSAPQAAGVAERFALLDCDGDACIGVVAAPASPATAARTGVVIVVGGPQYRVGSHRQFVLLARSLAAAGFPALRFDYRGMGDSDGERRDFEDVGIDIGCAVAALVRDAGVTDVVLWGLCDGASAALMYAAADPRIAGVVALNPWARSAQIAAVTRVRHYYVRRIVSGAFWRKMLTGGVGLLRGARELAGSLRGSISGRSTSGGDGYLQRMHDGWTSLRRPLLLVLSGHDFTAREFEQWVAQDERRKALIRGPGVEIYRSDVADHTFSDARSRDAVTTRTIEWIRRLPATC